MVPRSPSARSLVFRESAVIAAAPQRIWQLLTDLPGYADWNPWLVRASGELVPGGVVWAEVVLGARTLRAKHRVLVVEPEVQLTWRDAGWTTLFVYGQRTRRLAPRGDGSSQLTQELLLEGLLKGVAQRRYGVALQAGLAAETAALKRRAEAGPAGSG